MTIGLPIGDADTALKLAAQIAGEEHAAAYVEVIRPAVQAMVAKHWPEIKRVAAELAREAAPRLA